MSVQMSLTGVKADNICSLRGFLSLTQRGSRAGGIRDGTSVGIPRTWPGVVIPHASVGKVIEAAALLARREKVLLDAARKPGFSVNDLREAFSRMDEIH
jgi:hypothetical protein